MKKLTDGQLTWKRSVLNEVQSFLRTVLTKTAKSWFYFVSSKLIPAKHVSIVQKDKAMLPYVVVSKFKFNVGMVIENSILESVYRKAITHPPLITKLYLRAEVNMSRDEEKCPPPPPPPSDPSPIPL